MAPNKLVTRQRLTRFHKAAHLACTLDRAWGRDHVWTVAAQHQDRFPSSPLKHGGCSRPVPHRQGLNLSLLV